MNKNKTKEDATLLEKKKRKKKKAAEERKKKKMRYPKIYFHVCLLEAPPS